MSHRIEVVYLETSSKPATLGWIEWEFKTHYPNYEQYRYLDSKILEINLQNLENDIAPIANRGETVLYESGLTNPLINKFSRVHLTRTKEKLENLYWETRSTIQQSDWFVFPSDKLVAPNGENLIDEETVANQGIYPLSRALILSFETFAYDWYWSYRPR